MVQSQAGKNAEFVINQLDQVLPPVEGGEDPKGRTPTPPSQVAINITPQVLHTGKNFLLWVLLSIRYLPIIRY